VIKDHLNKKEEDLAAEALRPRPVFLWIASVTATLAVMAYLFEDVVIGASGGGAMGYALLLTILVVLSIFFVFCYRMPSLGNRLLGYSVAFDKPTERKEKSSLQYTGSFQVETGLSEKRVASRRKQARHSRRKLAEVTRQMQAVESATSDQKKAD